MCFVIQTRPSHSLRARFLASSFSFAFFLPRPYTLCIPPRILIRVLTPLSYHAYPARTHYAYHHAPLLFTGKKPEGIHPDTTFEYTARWTNAAPALAVVGGLPILIGLVFTFLPICVAFYKGRTPLAASAAAAAAADSAAAEEENA